jgi:hypothetical protein
MAVNSSEEPMWTATHSTTVTGLSADRVWHVWTDVNQWHHWQNDIEYARLTGDFARGNRFTLRPKGGPDVTIELTRVEPGSHFTDVTRFPLARMTDSHDLIERGDALEIRTTLTMEGPLAFLWRKLVGENIARTLPEQTASLIARARNA